MNSAVGMKRLAASARARASKKAEREAAAKRRREQTLDAEVRAGIKDEYEKEWLPKIKKAAKEGSDSVTLMLGSVKGYDRDFEVRKSATVRHLSELLEQEGYKISVFYPVRKYSDDHLGDEEVDIEVMW